MDIAVGLTQAYVVDPLLPAAYHAKNFLPTELFSIWLLLAVGSYLFYFFFCGLSYSYFFVLRKDKFFPETVDPEALRDQVIDEIKIASRNLPLMAVLFLPFTWGVTHGYSQMYYNVSDYGWGYLVLTVPFFLFVTDFIVYWAHRILHWGLIYKYIHKTHHTYRYTTPFSSHAFNFVDGWAQGVAYYIFVYLFPAHNILWLFLFMSVNMWTISIHDQVDFTSDKWFILSAGHHTIHHADFNYNYGQYFTIWDRLGGTYRPAYRTNEFLTGNKMPHPIELPKQKPRAKIN